MRMMSLNEKSFLICICSYKEIEISVRNVTWDLRMKKPYLDAPPCTDTQLLADSPWTSRMEKKTYTDGNINNPNGTGKYTRRHMARSRKFLLGSVFFVLFSFLAINVFHRGMNEFPWVQLLLEGGPYQ